MLRNRISIGGVVGKPREEDAALPEEEEADGGSPAVRG